MPKSFMFEVRLIVGEFTMLVANSFIASSSTTINTMSQAIETAANIVKNGAYNVNEKCMYSPNVIKCVIIHEKP